MPDVRTLRSTGWKKYLETNVPAADEELPDSGHTDLINETAIDTGRLIPMRRGHWRGIHIMPFGRDTSNDDFAIHVYHIIELSDSTIPQDATYFPNEALTGDRQYMWLRHCVLDCNLSAATGTDAGYIPTADFFCDTIVETKDAYGTYIEAAYGRAAVIYNPTGDEVASIWSLPDAGGPDFIFLSFDFEGGDGTAGTTTNALIKLDV